MPKEVALLVLLVWGLVVTYAVVEVLDAPKRDRFGAYCLLLAVFLGWLAIPALVLGTAVGLTWLIGRALYVILSPSDDDDDL